MNTYTYAEKSARMLEETISALRSKPVQTTYLERLQLASAVDKLYQASGLHQPLIMGYGMNYMLENCSCPVKPHDILVGRFAECIPTEEEEAWLAQYKETWEKPGKGTFLIDGGHTTFDWEELLHLGISGCMQKAE